MGAIDSLLRIRVKNFNYNFPVINKDCVGSTAAQSQTPLCFFSFSLLCWIYCINKWCSFKETFVQYIATSFYCCRSACFLNDCGV